MATIHRPVMVREADLRVPEEARRIDAFVLAHEDGTPFHRPAWLTAIERGTGQQAMCLLAEDADGTIAGLLPLHLIHSPLFGRALVSSGFAVGGGILAQHGEAADMLAEAGWRLAQSLSCPTMELRGGRLPASGWTVREDVYLGFVKPLAGDDEAELLAIPRKQRAEVRKALDSDLTVEIGSGQRDRDWHYAVYAESVRNLGTPVFPQSLFGAVLDAFGEGADILTILSDGEPVSSVLSLYHGETVMPYWGGGSWRARRLRANELLYYGLMNHARRRGCRQFDFGRSKAGTGPAAYKKNWGFEQQPLRYAVRAAPGHEARDVNPMSAKYRLKVDLWKRLPLSIANRLGPVIARGLG